MRQKKVTIGVLILLSILVTGCFFYPIIGHLNHVLLTVGGDGIKNYFTYLFYIGHDTGVHFTGMNYPFGEDVVFTDNTPLLAWIIKGLSVYFPAVADYALGILHTSILASLTVGTLFIFKIIKRFDVPDWWAVVSALFILYFSPQIFKLTGFFGMAFLMYLPMIIYWLMCYHGSRKLKYPVFITILTILFTFLHVYQLAFSLALCTFYGVAFFITNHAGSIRSKIRHLIPLFVSMIISWAATELYMRAFDHIVDRTSYPYGVFGATTKGGDIFTSKLVPLGFVFQFLFGRAHGLTEGYTYIGLVAIAVFVFLSYRIVLSQLPFKKNRLRHLSHPVRKYRIWLWVTFFELLLAMGVPFSWGLRQWAEYFPGLRQIRSMGRFSWGVYYLFLIFCAIFIFRFYQWMVRKGHVVAAKILMGLVIIISTVQLHGYVHWMHKNVDVEARSNYDDYFSLKGETWPEWLKQRGYSADSFQAIMALPFFHIGSEKLWLQDNDDGRTMYFGSQLSIQTGIPMIDVKLSRTSWSQTFATVQLVDGPFSAKPLLDSFTRKPVLVLVNTHFPLKRKEKQWIRRASVIGHRKGLDLYCVHIKQLIESGKRYRDSLRLIACQLPADEGLIGHQGAFYFVDHFDNHQQQNTFTGSGAFNPAHRRKEQLIADIKPCLSDSVNQNYFFSIWVHCNDKDFRSPYFVLKQYDREGRQISETYTNTKYSTHVIKNWYLVDKVVSLKKSIYEMKIFVVSPFWGKSYLALDNLALWPTKCIYYYKPNDSTLLLNNRPQN